MGVIEACRVLRYVTWRTNVVLPLDDRSSRSTPQNLIPLAHTHNDGFPEWQIEDHGVNLLFRQCHRHQVCQVRGTLTEAPRMTADSPMQLLLVEDSAPDAGLIQANLKLGLGSIIVSRVERLADGIVAADQTTFDVVLLDLNLPDSTGVETFRQLSAKCNGTPIVVLSGMDDTETAIRAVAAGAEDYVQKSHYEAQTLARSVRFAIERCNRMSAEKELISVRSELTAAQNIQDSLYPQSAPMIDGMDIAYCIRSAGMGCGDYFDFVPLHDGRQIIVVGDVSGHGMGPAMVMAETRASLRTLADVGADLNVMLPAINRMICAGATDGMFVTMLMVVHDPKTQSFEYFNAGHPGWVITESDGRQLRTHQIPLGFSIDTDYSASDRLVLEPGDILLMPTDGIQETPGEEGLFGTVRMLEIVRQRREDAAHLIVEGLIDAAIRFSGSQKPNDDMTAIVIKAL